MSSSSQNLYQNIQSVQQSSCQIQGTQSPMLSTFQSQTKVSYVSQSGGVVYAQPVQIMGSPNAVRRINNFRSQSADRKFEGNGLAIRIKILI